MNKNKVSLAGASVVIAMLVMMSAPKASAASLFWSGNGTSQGGAGTWNNSSATNWGTVAGGPYATVWNNATPDSATFGGTAGTVTLGTGITAAGITFTLTGYTIATSTNTLTMATGAVMKCAGNMTETFTGTLAAADSTFHFLNTTTTAAISNATLFTVTYGFSGANNVDIQANGASAAAPVVLSGTLAYTGTTTVANNAALGFSASTLNINNGSVTMGTSTTLLRTGGSLANATILKLAATTNTFAIVANNAGTANALDLSGTNGGVDLPNASLATWDNAGTVSFGFTGAITAGSNGYRFGSSRVGNQINIGGTSGTLAVTNNILTGTAGLTLISGSVGNVVLWGSNTYSGNTINSASGKTITLNNSLAMQNSAIDTSGAGTYVLGTGSSGTGGNGGVAITTPTIGGLIGSKNLLTSVFAATGYNLMTSLTLKPGAGVTNSYSGNIVNGTAALALIKSGAGTQVLAGANTYTGNTTVTGGTLNITGSLTGNTTTSTLALGTTAANTVVNVSGNMTLFTITGSNIAGSSTAYNQTAGIVNVTPGGFGQFVASTGYGYFNLTGGTFKNNTTGSFTVGTSSVTSVGVAYVGGTGIIDSSTATSNATIAFGGIASLTAGPGGTITRGSAGAFYVMTNSNSYGVLNVAGGTVDLGTSLPRFGNGAFTGMTGFVNLAGGTLALGQNTTNTATSTSNAYVNYAGGTLKANATLTSPFSTGGNITTASTIFGAIDNTLALGNSSQNFTGGMTVDTNGFDVTYGNPIGGATGNGVKQADITVTGGSGYIGAPLVQFTGGTLTANGTPASGYAVISGGAVTGVVITSPGTYTVDPTVTLTGGGGTGASVALSALTANPADTGLTKIGTGTLALSGANTYTGPTLVSAGTMQINGSTTTSSITVGSSGTLGFTPGTVSTLDLTGKSLTLSGKIAFDIGASGVNDTITVNDFTLNANSVLTFNPIALVPNGGSYTLLTSTNPITTNGFNITAQSIGKLTFAVTVNTNTITISSTFTEAAWNQTGGGNWSIFGGPGPGLPNWDNYLPSVAGDAALFGSAITGAATINVDAPFSVGFLKFNNSNAYTIGTGTSNLTLDNGASSAFVTVNSGSHTIAENVTLASNAVVAPATGTTLTISGNFTGTAKTLQLTDAGTLSLTGSTTGIAIATSGTGIFNESAAGVIGGAVTFTQGSTGTSILSGVNTYSGGTSITAGTLQLVGAGIPGPAGASVSVSSGALLDLNGTSQNIKFTAGTGVGIVANNLSSSTSTLTLAGTATINGSFVTIVDNTNSSSGKVAVVITANTSTMSNANTYSGGTTVNAGGYVYLTGAPMGAGTGTITLTALGANGATSSGLLVDGATYANDITGAGFVHNNANSGATVVTTTLTGNINTSGPFIFRAGTGIVYDFAGNGTTSTLSGVIGSATSMVNGAVVTGSIIKSGTGLLTLSGANVYTGGTTINGGTLRISGGSAIVNTGLVTLANGGGVTFQVVGSETIGALAGGGAFGGAVSIDASQTLTLSSGTQTYAGTVSGAGTLTNSGAFQTVSGDISLSGAVNSVNVTSAVLTLGGSNSNYTGTTVISSAAGILVTANNALGAIGTGNETTVTGTGGGLVSGALGFSGGINYTATEKIIGSGVGNTATLTGIGVGQRGFIQSVSGNNTFAGDIELSGNGNSRIGTQDGAQLTLTGAITQGTGVTTANILFRVGNTAGDFVTLSNAGNSFGGDSSVFTGSTTGYAGVRLGITNALPTNLSITSFATTNATFTALDLAGFNQTLNGLTTGSGAGALSIINMNTGTPSTLTLNPTTNTSTTNTLILGGGGLGVINVMKEGTFTQTIGTANTYTGGTILNQGTLTIGTGGTLGATTGTLSVNNSNSTAAGTDTVLNLATAVDTTVGGLSGTILTPTSGVNTATINTQAGRTFTVNQTAAGSYAGVIAGAGSFTLGSLSTNALTLNGNNTYSGATNVNAGTLIVNGTLSNSATTVNATGFLRGSGNGTTTGIVQGVTVSGGTLWPGAQTVVSGLTSNETLTATSANLATNGKLNIVINNTLGKTQKLVLTGTAPGTLNIDPTSILSLAFDTTLGSGVVIVDLTGTGGSISQPFLPANVLAGLTNVYGTHYSVIYHDSTGAQTHDSVNPTGSNFASNDALATGPYNQIIVQLLSGVTPVKVDAFAAKSEGAGVNVSWTAVSEYQNAGFNIYRRAFESTEWVKVNPELIAGRITNPDEKKYTYFDWAPAGMYVYKLESIDLFGGSETYAKVSEVVNVEWMGEFTRDDGVASDVVESATRGMEMEVSGQTARSVEGVFAERRALKAAGPQVAGVDDRAQVLAPALMKFNSKHSAIAPIAAPVQTQPIGVAVRWFSSGRIGTSSSYSAAKVMYKDSGVMLIPQSGMPAGLELSSVTLQREGRSLNALASVPGGVLVYAPGYKDSYTDKDAIFVRKSVSPTVAGIKSNSTGLFDSAMPVNVTSASVVTNNYHDVYFDYTLRPYSFEPWFSSKYLTQGSAQTFNVNLPNVASGSATLTANLWSLTSSDSVNPDHGLQLLVNGQAIGEASWDGGGRMMQVPLTIPPGVLKAGDNVVSLVTPSIAGLVSQISFLHSISVNYTRALDGSKPVEITNTSNAAALNELYNVPATGAWVVDARFGDRAALVPSESQVQSDGTLRVRFIAEKGGSGKYLVVPVGQENKPLSVNARRVNALKLNGTYLSTGPAQFASGVQPLLMKRAKEGIRGAYIDQEQLFDYYNYGRFGPDGIRNAVRSVRPAYLLLVGRTTYDYLNYEGQNVDPLCPAYLVSTNFWAQTTSDSAFGDLGRGYPEVAVGRLPVNNTTELSGAIGHILGYKGIAKSGLRLHAVADQPDPLTADFGAQLDTMVKAHNPDVTWQENYLARSYQTTPEVTAAMKEAANGGADLILYSGHGNAARLGNSSVILDSTSVQQWTGNTVFLQSTCTANWMAKNVDDYKSIAIQALTQSQGGISASIGTSTYMNSDVATAFMNQILKNASGDGVRWGSVLLKAQQWAGKQNGNAFYKDLMTTEQLFGDPAMPVYAPKSSNTTPSTTSNAAGTF